MGMIQVTANYKRSMQSGSMDAGTRTAQYYPINANEKEKKCQRPLEILNEFAEVTHIAIQFEKANGKWTSNTAASWPTTETEMSISVVAAVPPSVEIAPKKGMTSKSFS